MVGWWRYGAVVLAGGAGRRLGGPDKPTLPVGGRPMVHRVLAAVAPARPVIVVGPRDLPLPSGVRRTQEQPPGSGPVAAAATGLALLPARTRVVALLAADLPFLTEPALRVLRQRLARDPALAGVVYSDDRNRPQWLCGIWRVAALRDRLAALPAGPAGMAMAALLGDLPYASCAPTAGGGPPVWWDCDTTADLRQARSWT